MACVVCNSGVTVGHHLWSGHGQRVPCVFQGNRSSGRPGGRGLLHPEGCGCNEMRLCTDHHTGDFSVHRLGDMWLWDNSNDLRVYVKLLIRGKIG